MADNFQELIKLVEEDTQKAYNQAIVAQSIVETPTVGERRSPAGGYVFNIAVQADEFIPWGLDLRRRDEQLRGFWHSEPIMAGAVYKMSSRAAAAGWDIVGADPDAPRPKTTIRRVEQMLRSADRGQGWKEFIMKVAIDGYTQDNGAFIEKIRATNRPDSPVIGVAHLDSFRCTRTGDPDIPVIYRDRWNREHLLAWYQVETIEEMPSPVETMYGAQVCAVSRALGISQVIRDIRVYKKEKVSGQFAKSVHFISGVTRQNIEDGLSRAQEQAWNQNLLRYIQPPIISTLDPDSALSHVEIELASLPDGFDEETTMKWYIMTLALAFGVDYQEFAPLPGGALGSSEQSEILHLKASGPSTLIGVIEDTFNNNGILPANVLMKFRTEDARANEEKANARFLRGKDRALRLDAGEIDAKAARDLAVLDGDLPVEVKEQLDKRPMPDPVVRKPDPAGVEQVQGGLNSRQTRKAFSDDDLRSQAIAQLQLRKRIDSGVEITGDDIEVVRQRLLRKYNSPGFVCLMLENDPRIVSIMRGMQEWTDGMGVEWQPTPLLHMTLVYAPEVGITELREIGKELQLPETLTLEFDSLDIFENGGERAVHIRVKRTEQLAEVQDQVYEAFIKRGIQLSDYSNPAVWTPHITLCYLPANGVEFMPTPLTGMYTLSGRMLVTQGEYEPVMDIYPVPESVPYAD